MEPNNYHELDKQTLVDLLAKYTEIFSTISMGNGGIAEMDNVKAKIKSIQKEIMARKAAEPKDSPSQEEKNEEKKPSTGKD